MIRLQDLMNELHIVEQDDTEYQKVVRKVMDMVGVDEITDLNDDEKAAFFSYLDTIWDKENSKLRKEPEAEEIKSIMADM